MSWMRRRIAPAAAIAMMAAVAVAAPAFARPQSPVLSDALTELELATMLADPQQAARFLSQPDCLDRLAALHSSSSSGTFEKLRAALKSLLVLDEIRPRVQMALGVINHHLGFAGAAEGYLLAALADRALPAIFRDRANALLDVGRSTSRSGALSGSLTAGLHYGGQRSAWALTQSPEELTQQSHVQDLFVQFDAAHHFDTGFGGIQWHSTLHAQTTRVFDAAGVDGGLLSLSSGPGFPLDRFGVSGGLRLLGGVDFGAADDRLDWTAPGGSLLVDWSALGGNFAVALDWRERRFRNSAAYPNNSGRSGRELAGRFGYDFRLFEGMTGSANARVAEYWARRQSESYREWQVGFSLQSAVAPFLAQQGQVLASSEWRLGLFGKPELAPAPALGWLQQLAQKVSGHAMTQDLSFRLEGGFSRRDTPMAELDSGHWYGRTGLAWQF